MSEGPVGDAKAAPLVRYWTERVPEKYVNGLAAKYFRAVFGLYPGQRKDN